MLRKEVIFFIALVLAAVVLCQGETWHDDVSHVKRAHNVAGAGRGRFGFRRFVARDDATTPTPTADDKKDTSTGGMKSTDEKKDTTTTPTDTKDSTTGSMQKSDDKKDSTTPSDAQTADRKDSTTGTTQGSGEKKDATTPTDATQSGEKKDASTGGMTSTDSTTANSADKKDANAAAPASGAGNGQKAADASATGGSTNATQNDPDAPVIDFLLSNWWNSTYFLAQSDPNIKFIKNGNYSDQTQNSTATQPIIIGVEVMERRQYQVMEGLGAGLTDASAIVLQALKQSHPDAYEEILNLCFNESPDWLAKGGAGMNMLRTPIGASDFGFVEYTYDDTVDGSNDTTLSKFDVTKSVKRWQTIRDILKVNPQLRLMATPWSQPAWMKGSTGSLHGGSVLPQFEDVFGDYLVKFVNELEAKESIKVDTISLQNEPMYGGANYPCTFMPAYQQARIGNLTRKKLDAANRKNIGILAYDHNWDNTTYPIDVFDESAENFKGVAWHCYAGDPSGQDPFNRAYPGRTVWFTECTKLTQFFMEPWQNIKDQFSKLITTNGSIDYASSAVILWNLALQVDQDGFTTPTLPGVCKNCLAPILIFDNATTSNLEGEDKAKLAAAKADSKDTGPGPVNTATAPPRKRDTTPPVEGMTADQARQAMVAGQGTRNSTNPAGTLNKGSANEGTVIPPVRSTYYRSSDFVVLAHLGQAIRPREGRRWAQRVGVVSTEDTQMSPRSRFQLFRNDLGNGTSRWSLIILQWNDHFGYNFAKFEDVTFNIKFRDYVAQIRLPPGAFTLQWTAKDSVYETNPASRENTLGASRNTVRQ